MAFNPEHHHTQDTTSESQLLPPRPSPRSHSHSHSQPGLDKHDNNNNEKDNDDNDHGNDPDPDPDADDSASPSLSPPSQNEQKQEEKEQQLPLSMSTSLLLTSPTALPQSARTALAQINATLDPPTQKIQVRFHAVGGAPQLKQKVFKISASSRFGSVVSFLRKRLGLAAATTAASTTTTAASTTTTSTGGTTAGAESTGATGTVVKQQVPVPGLFCYINSVFAPGLDEGVGNLWRCFKTDEVLVVAYSLTPAFG